MGTQKEQREKTDREKREEIQQRGGRERQAERQTYRERKRE